jgi:hypothetical protein
MQNRMQAIFERILGCLNPVKNIEFAEFKAQPGADLL